METVLANESELHARVYQFPTSALKVNGRKINYFDFLSSGENADANDALKRVSPRIDRKQIEEFIDQVSEISELQKKFYKAYINARYQLIICHALGRITVKEQD